MITIIMLFSQLLYASVVKDDVQTTDKLRFPFKAVCQKMVTHESPLIEIVSGTELDCMGKKISVSRFCEKEMAHDPYYLRGYVDQKTKEVVCISGKKVVFRYLCTKLSDNKLCEDIPRNSCLMIKEKLAYRLDIVHSSFSKNEKGIKELNCQFESLPLSKKPHGSL